MSNLSLACCINGKKIVRVNDCVIKFKMKGNVAAEDPGDLCMAQAYEKEKKKDVHEKADTVFSIVMSTDPTEHCFPQSPS